MTLFLQNDAGGAGTGGVFADRGFVDLITISNMDTGLGQDPPVGDLIEITYTRSLPGIPPVRLDTLVNTDFAGVAGTTDIIVIPVDETFTRLSGTLVTATAGVTLPIGHDDNPTSSVLVIYDTSDNNGIGYCLPAEGGDTVGFPSAVILYHELSHALRFATNATLDNSDTGCAANDEENQAELDENDLRDQLGGAHRDATQHCTTTGCSGACCIVASVSTGSPYSRDVNELRSVRDNLLRGSEVGFDFFERLHYDYYSFSPQVVGQMAGAPELRALISSAFVGPLTRCLKLLHVHSERHADASDLGRRFIEDLDGASSEGEELTPANVALALRILRARDTHDLGLPTELMRLAEVLQSTAATSEFVRWGILDPLELYLEGVAARLRGDSARAIGERLATGFDEWAARLPLTDVWYGLSAHAAGEELEFLREHLLVRDEARTRFALRLRGHLLDRTAWAASTEAILAQQGFSCTRGAA